MYNIEDVENEYRRLDQILGIDTSEIQITYCKGLQEEATVKFVTVPRGVLH